MLRRSHALPLLFAPVLLVSAVTGCGEEATTTTVAPTQTAAPADQTVDGAQIYAVNCSGCHGSEAKGAVGPDLRPLTEADLDRVKDQVTNGGGTMPAFAETLSEGEIHGVATYVVGLD